MSKYDKKIAKYTNTLQKPGTGFWLRFQKKRAIKALAQLDVKEAVPPLLEVFLGKNRVLSEIAGVALKWMNAEEVKEEIAAAFCSTRKTQLLRILREGELIPSQIGNSRVIVLLKLGRIEELLVHDEKLIDPLIAALSDSDGDIVKNAEEIWHQLPEYFTSIIAQRFIDTREPRLAELIKRFSLLPKKPFEVRLLIALKLGVAKDIGQEGPEILPHLLNSLKDNDPQIQKSAQMILNQLKNPQTITELCTIYLKDRDPQLGSIIIENRYQPTGTLHDSILIRLKLGMTAQVGNENAEAVHVLLDARNDSDPEIQENALKALKTISNQASINRLCSVYLSTRLPILSTIISECAYQPTEPPEVKYLILLKLGKSTEFLKGGMEVLDYLEKALDETDPDISANADYTISALSRRDMIEELCKRIILGSSQRLTQSMLANGLEPREPLWKAIFYLVTDQLDKLNQLDPKSEHLQKALTKTEPAIRNRVLEKIRATAQPRLLALLKQ